MIQNIVYAKIAHTGNHLRLGPEQSIPQYLVLRYGKSDFENDGSFNGTNETYLESVNVNFSPSGRKQDWYYNESTEEFQDTAP